jgi:hypothetical protein
VTPSNEGKPTHYARFALIRIQRERNGFRNFVSTLKVWLTVQREHAGKKGAQHAQTHICSDIGKPWP